MNYKLQIQGLHCEACKKISEKRLSRLDGVSSVTVDVAEQSALIHTAKTLDFASVKNVLADTEYKVTALSEI